MRAIAWQLAPALALLAGDAQADARLLVFSKTTGYRHDSIPAAIAALELQAAAHDWTITATEDAAVFTDGTLDDIDAAVFLMNTGDVLDEAQQAGLQAFVEAGHGFVGIHSVTNAEEEWPWFGELLATRFADHPAQQDAIVHVVAPDHPACVGLPEPWMRFDEWYNFTSNPSKQVDVLLRLDESSYTGGTMGDDHPIAWTHVLSGARVFYTAGGHTDAAWADPLWLGHVAGGMQWVIEGEPVGTESSGTGDGESSSGVASSTSDGVEGSSSSTGFTDSSDEGASASSTGTSAPGSSDGTGGSAATETSSGCGCRQAAAPGWLAVLLLPLLDRRRR